MLKWNVGTLPNGTVHVYLRNPQRTEIVRGIARAQAEQIAAAHNAVIDMAFDSPGNVS